MANLSAQTEAIIERLRAEGDLVRNSGTNSIRSVRLDLQKFDGLFTTINSNIAAQTDMMRKQLGIAEEAAEAASTREQLGELGGSYTSKGDSGGKSSSTNEAIEKMGDQIADALSFKGVVGTLKNVALAGAGIMVGYNFLKGFINEKYDGAWDEMEEGIGEIGPEWQKTKESLLNAREKLDEFARLKVGNFQENWDTLSNAISELFDPETGSFIILSNSIKSISQAFSNFAANPLGATLGFVWDNLGALGLAVAGLRWWFVRARLDLQNGTRTVNGVPWWRRALGLGAADPTRPGGTPTSPLDVRGSGPNGSLTDAERLQRNQRLAQRFPERFTLGPQGGLQNAGSAGGGARPTYANQAQINQALEEMLQPRYAKAYRAITGLLKKVGLPVLTAITAYQILVILADDQTYPDNEAKAQALGPIIGGVVGGIGGAVIAGALATATGVGAGWGTLLFGLVGGVVGSTAVGSTQIGYYVAKWALDETPPPEATDAMSQYQGMSTEEMMKAHGFDASGNYVGFGSSTTPSYYDYMGGSVDQMYGGGFQGNGPLMSYGIGRGSDPRQFGDTPEARLAYEREREAAMLDALIEVQRQQNEKQEEFESLMDDTLQYLQKSSLTIPGGFDSLNPGTNGTVILNSPVTNVSAPMSMVNGGNQAAVTNVSLGGGGGGGPSLSPYGMTSGLVY